MALAKKDLNAVNDEIVIHLGGRVGNVMMQYPTGGTGTILLEGSGDDDDYTVLFAENMATGVGTAAGLAAAGKLLREVSGLEKVRARKSAGVGACFVSLSVSD